MTLLRASPGRRVFVEPCNVGAAWRTAGLQQFSSSEQRQWGLQAGVNPILGPMHRVAQQRRSTRACVEQTRGLVNVRRCGGFRCQSIAGTSGQLRRASCRRPLNRYPPAGRLEIGTGNMKNVYVDGCRAKWPKAMRTLGKTLAHDTLVLDRRTTRTRLLSQTLNRSGAKRRSAQISSNSPSPMSGAESALAPPSTSRNLLMNTRTELLPPLPHLLRPPVSSRLEILFLVSSLSTGLHRLPHLSHLLEA